MKAALAAVLMLAVASSAGFGQTRKPVSAKKGTVTRVVAIAKPKSYNGPAPATIEFVGTIFVKNPPVRVEYEWIRSDGAIGQRQTIEIQSAGQGVTDSWQLGAPNDRMRVWEKVHVISPVNRTSAPATAAIHCEGSGPKKVPHLHQRGQ